MIPQRRRQRFGLDHARKDQFAAGGDALDLLEAEAFEIAFAHVIPDVDRAFRRQPERFERGAAELQRRFEGLAHLVIHALGEQFEAVAPVEGAHVKFQVGKFRPRQFDNPAGCQSVIDADRNQPHIGAADRGAQHVEPQAVAVIDLEAEPAGALDHLGVVIEGDDVDRFREQALRHDLPEAAEADDEGGAADLVEVVGLRAAAPAAIARAPCR